MAQISNDSQPREILATCCLPLRVVTRLELSPDTMPVYIRTAAGTAAALNPLVKLPRNLRQLLVAIDGETPASAHAARMAGQGNIQVLLDTLQLSGLIRHASPAGERLGDAAADFLAVEPVARTQAGRSPAPPLAAPPLPASFLPAPESAQPPTRSGAIARSPAFVPQTDRESTRTRHEPEAVSAPEPDGFAEFGTETAPADLRPAGPAHYALGSIISLMSDFVTEHLPDRALEIVLALESLTSVSQVSSSLDDYRALIAPMGDAAQRHLAELQHLLQSD